ncbi:MAG: hypothetical protein H0V05_18555 [Euzebyaceae bacterium]|nr:hypothetical protein [Euzebyaceae bacterium]
MTSAAAVAQRPSWDTEPMLMNPRTRRRLVLVLAILMGLSLVLPAVLSLVPRS